MNRICHKLLHFCFAITLLSCQSTNICVGATQAGAAAAASTATSTAPDSYENDSVVIGDIAAAEQRTQPEALMFNHAGADEEHMTAAAGALTTTTNNYYKPTIDNGKLQSTMLDLDDEGEEEEVVQTQRQEQLKLHQKQQQQHQLHYAQHKQRQHKQSRQQLQPSHHHQQHHHPVFSEFGQERSMKFKSHNKHQRKHYQQKKLFHRQYHQQQQKQQHHHQHQLQRRNKDQRQHQQQQEKHQQQQHQSPMLSHMLYYRQGQKPKEQNKAAVMWDYQNDGFVADEADESWNNNNFAADSGVDVAEKEFEHNEALAGDNNETIMQTLLRLGGEGEDVDVGKKPVQSNEQKEILLEAGYEQNEEKLLLQEQYEQQKSAADETDEEIEKRVQAREEQEEHQQEQEQRHHKQPHQQQQKKQQQHHQQQQQKHHRKQHSHKYSTEQQNDQISQQQQRSATSTPYPVQYEDQLDWDTKLHTYSSKDYFAASPRSGRHRGRHVTPPSSQNQVSPLHLQAQARPLPTSVIGAPGAGLFSGIASKVFRSLPDSEQDFNGRMMVADPLMLPRLLTVAVPPLGARHWPVKHEAIVEGDLILGGLMMVHSREDTITCGPIMPQGGIQALEAMLYTIDRINEAGLLPNVTLGAHILDDCDKDSYGLEMAVDFIKGSISNIDDAEYYCNKTQIRKVISGVVGAASSVTSIQVANLLRLFRIPQVSFFSTSPELSNKQRFEYFCRTIPSDHHQVKAMVEIVKRMGWSYVSIIYEESNYGIKAFEELEELLARFNICIAIKEKLVKDSGVAEEIAYDNIVQKLLTKPRARGVIVFGSDQEVKEVMRAVRRNNATGAFSWIGSDGWSARNLVSDGNEPEVEGTLSVQPQANPIMGFEGYFLNLTVENNQRNPWFVEFWEDHFQCRYPGSATTPYNNYTNICTTKELLSTNRPDFEDQLQFVSDAVMAFAYALRDMHRDLCGGRPGLCDAMKPTKGADLLKYLRKVQFQGLSGDHFRFDGNGDGPARYNIIHFKQTDEGKYHWVKVGEYNEGELQLNMSEVQFKLLHPKPPESVCSLPCERGQAKKYVEGESCCWHCFNCSTYQIRHPLDETQCQTCQLGTLPDATKQLCQTIPEVFLRPESAWAIGAMTFSAIGILVTLFVIGVFVRHNDTPIVRASGRELSYILLAGILMCYAVTFALVMRPTNVVCCIQRFCVGFCFTVVDAALLTKTNRIARIFKAGKQSAKRPSFISPKSQLVICTFLIFVQILINGVWLVISPSHAMYHHPTREDNMLVCDSYIDASYMIAFFYPIVLIVICTVYAVLTRKIPEAFNESKHIGFTMYTTCVIWLAFVPLYFGTANHVPLRITSMSVTISLSASVTIACLFAPKLYIILIRPERNVRQSMMPPRHGNMHRTAGTGPSSMMAAAVVTAATCAQEEKLAKHITPTSTECNNTKAKKLCEMATQTITISSIFTNLDSSAYNQIPYADQYVPNNNHTATATATAAGVGVGVGAEQQQVEQQHVAQQQKVVANNNKINQEQHGNPTATAAAAMTTTATTATATAINGAAAVATTPLGNHIMLQQHTQQQCNNTTTTTNNECNKLQQVTTTTL